MGSIGVNTGRITTTQLGKLLTGDVARGYTGAVSDRGGVPDRLFIDNEGGRGGFTINMSGVSQSTRNAFLRALRGRAGTDNPQSAYNRAYREQVALNANRAYPMPEATMRRIAEEARERVARNVVSGVISNNSRFRGIRINNRINRNRVNG